MCMVNVPLDTQLVISEMRLSSQSIALVLTTKKTRKENTSYTINTEVVVAVAE